MLTASCKYKSLMLRPEIRCLSQLGHSKSSQVVSGPSLHQNFPFKSPPNFRIKVMTYSQNTV